MEANLQKLVNSLEKLSNRNVLILGDIGLDEYVDGSVHRISPEAPVPVVEVVNEDRRIGLSGNVAQNVSSLRANAHLLGVVGDDEAGENLRELLQKQSVNCEAVVVDHSRPTTRKLRIMTGQHHIVRVDYEKKRFLSEKVQGKLVALAAKKIPNMDVMIIQDYAKGVISEKLVQELIKEAKKHGVPVLVDPHRSTPLSFYRGATLFKPNHDEAVALCGLAGESLHRDSDYIEKMGQQMLSELQAEQVVLTRGKDGMSLFSSEKTLTIETKAKDVFDVTGAGDTVIAALALAIAGGLTSEEACRIANFAAGVVVAEVGCVPCTQDQLRSALLKDAERL